MIVKLDNISKVYNKIPVVNALSLNIEKGERVIILGPSGCGKTTLLRMVAGFISPDDGQIIIDNQIVAANGRCIVAPETRQVGMVFQDLALWPHMSVYKNLEFGLKVKRVSKKERDKRIRDMLEKVQMTQFIEASPSNISRGQQQRVAIARALIMQPAILLMDEPLSGLDVDLNLLLRKEILRLQKELDITMLYVTHNRDEAFSLATRIVVMEEGKIQRTGTVKEISEYLTRSSYKT
ncbi:MAG: ABC transporter ATP-binding protein [Candidatus Anammoxibacter sp.]